MAGAGYRTFASGEVLTSTNAQTYWMDQVVAKFADATARDAAITSPTAGQHCYLVDVGETQSYTGSSWAQLGGGGASGFENTFLLMGA
jgi:hypothetical protein